MIEMGKRIALMVVLILLLGLPAVAGEGSNYYSARPDEYGTYVYFSSMLWEFSSVLDGVLNGENGTVESALELYALANTTYETLVLYSGAGIDERPLELVPYFLSLGSAAFEVASGEASFRASFSEGEYAAARAALVRMKRGLRESRDALSAISKITLKGKNGTVLTFNTADLYPKLDALEALAGRYEELLDQVQVPENFTLFISNPSPMALENVTFYGFTLGLRDIHVVVSGENLAANVTSGTFHLDYSFPRPGTYKAYAVGFNGTFEVISNVLTINVSGVPTKLLVTAISDGGVLVEGHLVDYFGRALPWKRVILTADSSTYYGITDENGSVRFFIANVSGTVNATVLFPGDGIHLPTSAGLVLTPPLRRPAIRLFHDGSRVRAGEEVVIRGKVDSTYPLPLTIYVDGKGYSTLVAKGEFTFTLSFSPGRHEVYAYFAGSETLAPSSSNVLTLEAAPVDYTRRFLLFVFLLLLAFTAYRFTARRRVGGVPSSQVPEAPAFPPIGEEGEERPDIGKAYRTVYGLLKRLYDLPGSTTPRELVSALRHEPFAEHLKILTRLHEVTVYGKKKFGLREVLRAVKHASLIIVGVFVRDEL
ncbi:Ig-like domain-containing protein [Thermococcus thioreducens]|uniref:Ig-like domain-containing protein n=1 Tax=Thermococcus thioreducens TaxID=277988 RepID=UPI00117F3DC3|nr:Ig-like domain-containing protein [Thermococcus thioreducens]